MRGAEQRQRSMLLVVKLEERIPTECHQWVSNIFVIEKCFWHAAERQNEMPEGVIECLLLKPLIPQPSSRLHGLLRGREFPREPSSRLQHTRHARDD
jgi:hypothetical protein